MAELLKERTAPELLYLEAKWSSLLSFGVSCDLLGEVLPNRILARQRFGDDVVALFRQVEIRCSVGRSAFQSQDNPQITQQIRRSLLDARLEPRWTG